MVWVPSLSITLLFLVMIINFNFKFKFEWFRFESKFGLLVNSKTFVKDPSKTIKEEIQIENI